MLMINLAVTRPTDFGREQVRQWALSIRQPAPDPLRQELPAEAKGSRKETPRRKALSPDALLWQADS